MSALIELHDVGVHFRGHWALEGISGSFAAGESTCIVGPNGGGKSSLIRLIAGLLPAQRGSVVRHLPRAQIAWLPQLANIERSVPVSALDAVCLGHWRRAGWFGRIGPELRRAALDALAEVEMAECAAQPLHSLSSGQLQRVLFARLLLQDGQLILLDEPFNAIDARSQALLMRLIDRWRDEGRTLIAVLHDLPLARAHFANTLLLAQHCLGWGPTEQVLSGDALERARIARPGAGGAGRQIEIRAA